jgi:hypothetical protein
MRRLQVMVAAAIGIASALPAQALPDRAIGAVTAASANLWRGPADRSVEQMVGHKLVFLEKAPHERAAGYTAFRIVTKKSAGGLIPAYADFVGKRIQIETVKAHATGEYLVTAMDVESGVRLQARTRANAIADVAPVGDLYRAKARWLGQTVYPRKRTIQTYDPATHRYGNVAVRLNEPLKVVDVIWGMSATKPLWVVVQRENGDKGFIATAYSWTNAYSDWVSVDRPWEGAIAETTTGRDHRAYGLAGRLSRSGGFNTASLEDRTD